jgi:RNA polymerase sigma factor (sigma-70 family)
MASGLAMGGTLRHLRDLFHEGTALGLGDAQLLSRYAESRDQAAFEALVARHGTMVLATCRAVLRHDHDVEDAFQATFLVLARKARTVRAGEALGGWLHRVAYGIAVQALGASRQRRRREAEAAAMATLETTRPGPEPDLAAIVHEEVDRLPDRQRLPVILCDLEGLTYQQAAGRLRWTDPTLRHRLLKGRRRLRERLTRRGVTAGAIGIALAAPTAGAKAAVPAALARAAVAAAAGGSTSATAAALAATFLRGLLLARLKLAATGLLAAIAIGSAGALAVGPWRPDPPRAALNPQAAAEMMRPPAVATATPALPAPEAPEWVEVRGRVVDPQGRPVAGAAVHAGWPGDHLRTDRPTFETTSGPDGRFRLRVARPDPMVASIYTDRRAALPWVAASAPGLGPGLAEAPDPPGEWTVGLVADGPPIEGHLIDLEGRPVAGARVQLRRLWYTADMDLPTLIEKNRAGTIRGIWEGLRPLSTTKTTTAIDRDGRFRLTSIGRDRVAELLVSGPTVATTVLYAMSRPGPEARGIDRWPEPQTIVFRPSRFDCALAPTKPIEGVLRDKDTGRPIAGVRLRATAYNKDSSLRLPAEGVEAMTDDRGRYRLTGLPAGLTYRIFVEPGEGRPYFRTDLLTPAGSRGFEPMTFDIALKRGVLVRGRVTDKATGRPVPGYVQTFTFYNPLLDEFPDASHPGQATIQPDGRYEAVAMPGRAIIACRSDISRYRTGLGAEAIPGLDPRHQSFDTRPHECYAANYHILAEVELDPRSGAVIRDLQVDPGRTVAVTAVDPEGRPLGGTRVSGVADLLGPPIRRLQDSPMIEVHGLDPSRPRPVTIAHDDRKLIGSIILKGDEPGPLTVRLQPWGTITGRIIDDEGRPRGGIGLWSAGGGEPPPGYGILPGGNIGQGIWIGPDGRFRIERLVPGLKYGISVMDGVIMQIGELVQGVTVAPGQTRDLGDLKVIPLK